MSKFTATLSTRTIIEGLTITLTDEATIEQFKDMLADAKVWGPLHVQPLARDLFNYISDRETQAVKPETEPVRAARTSAVVAQHIADGKRILAIKEVRLITSCGLEEAKDAVDEVFPYVR